MQFAIFKKPIASPFVARTMRRALPANGSMILDAGNAGKHMRAYYDTYEPGTFMSIDDWASVGGAVCASEPANAMDYACCAKVRSVATEIQPRQAEVVTVMEGAVRECPRLESPQERGVVMQHRSVCGGTRVDR